MSKIALHLNHLSATQKVALVRNVQTAMAGNATYANPDVPLAALGQSADALEAAAHKTKAAHDAWLAAASAQRDTEHNVDESLRAEARYAERASGGDETKLRTSGFELAATPVHGKSALGAPASISATQGDRPGEVDVHWDKLVGARAYQVATGDTADGPFTMVAGWTASKGTLEGLPSGKKLWVRAAGFDSHGPGAWSAAVVVLVP